MRGIGVAFALDAASFLASVTALSLMRLEHGKAAAEAAAKERTVLSSIVEGLSALWKDRVLRYYFMLIAAANFLITGPFSVGIPVLAHTRYSGGAAAFGIILSAYGAGSLAGVLLAGSTRRPSARKFPALMLGLTAFMGVSLVLLGVMPAITPAAMVATIMGLAQGYVVIQFVTWLQMRTPARMLGRTMSLLMFAVVGSGPGVEHPRRSPDPGERDRCPDRRRRAHGVVVAVGSLSPSVWRLGDDTERDGTAPFQGRSCHRR